MSGAIGEVQKRRDGFPDRVPADSVGSIVAHEAIVFEPSRAFFRAVEPEAERNNASAPQGRLPLNLPSAQPARRAVSSPEIEPTLKLRR